MSRAYRLTVSDSLTRVVRAADHVSTDLEMLEILPCERMAELLQAELQQRGFELRGERLVREEQGLAVEVDPQSGTVTVRATAGESVTIDSEQQGRVYDDMGAHRQQVEEALREQAQEDMERKMSAEEARLQQEVTDRLEAALRDLKPELDQAVNRVTADALKEKARQLGQIKELSENEADGSLKIVLEV